MADINFIFRQVVTLRDKYPKLGVATVRGNNASVFLFTTDRKAGCEITLEVTTRRALVCCRHFSFGNKYKTTKPKQLGSDLRFKDHTQVLELMKSNFRCKWVAV